MENPHPHTATLLHRDQTYTVPAGMTVRDALKKINLSPEAVLAVHAGQLITPDDFVLRAGMVIKLVAVISGG